MTEEYWKGKEATSGGQGVSLSSMCNILGVEELKPL